MLEFGLREKRCVQLGRRHFDGGWRVGKHGDLLVVTSHKGFVKLAKHLVVFRRIRLGLKKLYKLFLFFRELYFRLRVVYLPLIAGQKLGQRLVRIERVHRGLPVLIEKSLILSKDPLYEMASEYCA